MASYRTYTITGIFFEHNIYYCLAGRITHYLPWFEETPLFPKLVLPSARTSHQLS